MSDDTPDDDFDYIAEHYARRAAARFIKPYKEQVAAVRKQIKADKAEIRALRTQVAELEAERTALHEAGDR
jgi:hypothetical protein